MAETQNTSIDTNNAKALIEFVKEQAGAKIELVDHPIETDFKVPLAVLPNGKKLESLKPFLDAYRAFPERRQGRAALRTLQSLIDHTNRFKNYNSALFADPSTEQPRIVSVLDYHLAGPEGRARWGQHRGMYDFPLSEAWKAWKEIDGEQVETQAFAEFLENRVEDVCDPSGLKADSATRLLADKLNLALATPAAVMAASRGLSIHVNHDVEEHRVLETGEVTFQFTERHEPKGGAKIPAAFAIAIPVFENGDMFVIAVRLRYRVQGPRITWIPSLYRTDRTFDQAFRSACEKAKEATALPLFYGTPE